MGYLWQNEDWPSFRWNKDSLMESLLELKSNEGVLEGQMKALGFKVQSESTLERFTKEIKNSFEIEGVNLNEYSLRSSIARKLGYENVILAKGETLDKVRPKIDSIVEVITEAVHDCRKELTEELLFQWHRKLFGGEAGKAFNGLYSIRVGQYRTDEEGPMRVISGYGKNETIHFEAPPAESLPMEMNRFFQWFNTPCEEQGLNSVLKSAVAHLYFVELHPFEDGNGRLSRAISDMALCRGDKEDSSITDHLFSMSAQLCHERKDYYRTIQAVEASGSMDITEWLLWYVGCMNRAILSVLNELKLSQGRRDFWSKAETLDLNERQEKIIKLLLGDFEGNLTSIKYAKICKCSQDTASRDIEKLIQKGILKRSEAGGRSTSYIFLYKIL